MASGSSSAVIKAFLVRRLMMGGEQAFRAAVGPCLALALVVAVVASRPWKRRLPRWARIAITALVYLGQLLSPRVVDTLGYAAVLGAAWALGVSPQFICAAIESLVAEAFPHLVS